MNNDIINTLENDYIIAGTYADIYLDNDFDICEIKKNEVLNNSSSTTVNDKQDVWTSPSDTLIGVLDLKPPFTSKYIRGKTHEGILAIGNDVLVREKERFYKALLNVLHDNDGSWNYILQNELETVKSKIKNIFYKIFEEKKLIMMDEISSFYQESLTDLEAHIKSEVENILISSQASILSELDTKIQKRLKEEKTILEKVLNKQYNLEVNKIRKYYRLLLHNEILKYKRRNNKLIQEKNYAIKAFYKQIESERITSTMYVLCLERKKCKIKSMLLENYQNLEIMDELRKLREKEIVLDDLDTKEIPISILNQQWEERIVKILQLFLKFMSFCFKLLPEQMTFLLDFEKMVILQLNEIQKQPNFTSSILINEEEPDNIFEFKLPSPDTSVCNENPFVIIGDLSDPVPIIYGSRETLKSEVDLPFFRVGRQYVYAKCHGYEGIKKMLESNICKCSKEPNKTPSGESIEIEKVQHIETTPPVSLSSNERFIEQDIGRLKECPTKKCRKPRNISDFPFLASYLDFSEENYKRVEAILKTDIVEIPSLTLINEKEIAYSELPFSTTKETSKTIGTQYSSQEDISTVKPYELTCECIKNMAKAGTCITPTPSKDIQDIHNMEDIFIRRERSLNRLLRDYPKLLNIFTDECYDYKL